MVDDDTVFEDNIPSPTGYRILVAIPDVADTFTGGIAKADATMRDEEVSTVVMRVVELGPDAYRDDKRFPNGPYCKEGDYVIIRAYAGTRFKIFGKEMFRIINDDSVEAVVKDPSGLTRI